jgi:hypothetical protein
MAKTYNTISTFTSGQVLTAAQMNEIGTNVNNYRVPPMCRVSLSGNQSIANTTLTDLSWATQDVDTDGMFAPTSTTITIQTAGLYLLNANVLWSTASTVGQRHMVITRNAAANAETPAIAGSIAASVSAGVNGYFSASAMVSCAVNDTIKVNVYQNSGSPLNVVAGTSTQFSVAWLGQVS